MLTPSLAPLKVWVHMLEIFIAPDTVKTFINLDALLVLCGCQIKRVSSPFTQQHSPLIFRKKPCAYGFDVVWLRRRPYENAMIRKSVSEEFVKVGTRGVILGCSRTVEQSAVQV